MLIYNPQLILDEVQSHFSQDIGTNRKNLLKVVETLAKLHQAIADSKVRLKPWEYYCDTLIQKLMTGSLSILKLSEGYNLNAIYKDKETVIIDAPSILILTRSVLECYLTMYHLYFADIPEDEKHFRFKLWEVSGLISRQNFEGEKDGMKEKKASEKKIIDEKLAEIRKDKYYAKLGKRDKGSLDRYGLPRVDSFHGMIKKSNLKQSQFSNMYSFFSNYAHSEYLALMQMNQGNLNADSFENTRSVLASITHVHLIISSTIHLLKDRFPVAKMIYTALPLTLSSAIDTSAGIAFGHNKKK